MDERTTEISAGGAVPPLPPARPRRRWARRYLRSIIIGAALAFSVEMPFHA